MTATLGRRSTEARTDRYVPPEPGAHRSRGSATVRTVVLRRIGSSTPVTAGVALAAENPRTAFATIGLAALAGGMVLLMVLSSVQAFFLIAQQGASNTRTQLAIDGQGEAGVVGDAALLLADGLGAIAPGQAASGTAIDTNGQPTAPVMRDETVVVHGIRVHTSIAENLRALIDDAAADGVTLAGWGWRDPQTQIRLRREHCGTTEYAVYQMPSSQCSPPTARPGRSQHERGLAIDFTYNGGSISTRQNTGFRWLDANAARYGFSNLASEPWHWSTTGR